ncbi:MAG TPA: hypothetical protein VJT31_34380 [Rugosimonospora sp.]|nr:hypothetical protein [Rugosimonospora sp.]
MQVITIETDTAGAVSLREAAGQLPGAAFDARQIQAQVGDPDTWMFVAQLAPAVMTAFSATILALIRQRKIKYIKVNDIEFRDITAQQVSEIMKALDASRP